METTRREFLATGLPAGVAIGAAMAAEAARGEVPMGKRGYSVDEIERMIRREGKVQGLTKDDLPTPALLVDLEVFEANLKKMQGHAGAAGKGLRPHAKTHKCAEIARRQAGAGALGVSVATVSEAEVMVRGGVKGVLLTSPIVSPQKVERMVRLVREAADLMVAVDHPQQVELYQSGAAGAGVTVNVLVDLDVGMKRTGAVPGEAAVELARLVARAKNLRLRGLQAYAGHSSHVVGFEARKENSRRSMEKAIETRAMLERAGLPAEILSGTSTGTYNIDSELKGVTELQVGSYVLMDVDYRRIGGRGGEVYDDFGVSLTVLATVVSATHQDRVTIDAGFKAFATDRRFGPEAKDVSGVRYEWGGDEFGILMLEQPSREIRLGDRLEFIVPHCDPTVNLYDRMYACRGERVEEVWGVMDRLRA